MLWLGGAGILCFQSVPEKTRKLQGCKHGKRVRSKYTVIDSSANDAVELLWVASAGGRSSKRPSTVPSSESRASSIVSRCDPRHSSSQPKAAARLSVSHLLQMRSGHSNAIERRGAARATRLTSWLCIGKTQTLCLGRHQDSFPRVVLCSCSASRENDCGIHRSSVVCQPWPLPFVRA